MISAEDLYKVLSALVPLYVAMILAYGSVRWWKILTPDQCGGINRFVAIFAVPFLSFHIIASNDPYKMNAKFIAADTLQKIAILFVLGLWARYSRSGSLEWMITLFMLATLPNTLVMGIPLLAAMYGVESGSLVVQAVVLQCIIWYTLLLFLYEFRSARILISEQFPETAASIVSFKVESDVMSLDGREPLQTEAEIGNDGKIHVTVRKSISDRSHAMLSPRRSVGLTSMPSSKAITPRPSNLTGAEIYSIHSSRNLTPRESSFNHTDFSSVVPGRPVPGSPRQSNLSVSDVYSLHSSRAPTPRTSNFTEESSKDLHDKGTNTLASPRFSMRPYYPGGSMYGARAHGTGGMSVDVTHTGYQGAPRVSFPGAVFSPKHYSQNVKKADPGTSPKLEDDAKELHKFVWSSSASPVSAEGKVQVFKRTNLNGEAAKSENNPKDMKVVVGVPNQSGAAAVTLELGDKYEDRDDFSFGNRASFGADEYVFGEKDEPSLSKMRSSSTAELTPKVPAVGKKEMPPATVMLKLILSMVWRKLVRNPNTYSSLLGLIWALVSYRWHKEMPLILGNSIAIISNAGLGMAMFSLGLFMALQKRLLACGTSLALFGMVVRFLTGPAVMAATSIAVGLRGVGLRVSIMQAALPQGIVPFVFAKEYNVHPDVLSTAVIFGMLVALPINLVYYILLGL
ncbi:hypothetical protein O6H91_16G033800 [Diphasiastrum complanatum]|uniref:Uncharacterized protein n=4 Tax=Diphasiastrum complanatum TaxID=34168 RepID=A0ACC2BBC3_DIPCM|nr:hypothetical protein O6H91_Y498300 [Diphasiastrum complanatum]KAJ7199324.1 hypothetical protein O6H91_Y498300 [Diphasiastrum complanatum]KAJ7527045.1 hypothetical protein O6H91_16G033800 [Diphasiastrum complanatum]KAJ7527046.1 hypothetical protein O6H91_16G033800 [Diphasiastrum complanatum]KAJ7527047.1 hypothetical protein O6H91_16G033800 [Diphasiastrum complanatum]